MDARGSLTPGPVSTVFLSGQVSEGGREGPEEEKLWQ